MDLARMWNKNVPSIKPGDVFPSLKEFGREAEVEDGDDDPVTSHKAVMASLSRFIR